MSLHGHSPHSRSGCRPVAAISILRGGSHPAVISERACLAATACSLAWACAGTCLLPAIAAVPCHAVAHAPPDAVRTHRAGRGDGRFALVAESGIVTHLAVDDGHVELRNTSAESIMEVLSGATRNAGSGGGGAAAAPLQALMSQGTSLEPADEALTSSQGKALGAVCVVLVLAALYSSSIGI